MSPPHTHRQRSTLVSSEFYHNRYNATPPPRNSFKRLFIRALRRTRIILLISSIALFGWLYRTYISSDASNLSFKWFSSRRPYPSYSTPRVPREVFERLKKPQENLTLIDLSDTPSIHEENLISQTDSGSTPLVTSLPENRLQSPPSTPGQMSISRPLPNKSCPAQESLGLPCAFLVAGFVGEQETKAQIHLHQLGLLALSLNRTLVLPQVGKSRMGSCLEYPFELYYDRQALDQLKIPTVTHADFIHWTQSRSPSARLVSISDIKLFPSEPTDHHLVTLSNRQPYHLLPFKPDRKFCLTQVLPPGKEGLQKDSINLNFSEFKPLMIAGKRNWHTSSQQRSQFAKLILDSLRQSEHLESDGRAEVLVLNYEIRHPFLDLSKPEAHSLVNLHNSGTATILPPFEHYPYAFVWVELAKEMINHIPPFVAIHWRQETIPINQLNSCANSLIESLESLKTSFPSLMTAYFSTDYPLETLNTVSTGTLRAHSGTFSKLITEEHHLMMRQLMNRKRSLDWMTYDKMLDNLEITDVLVSQLDKLPNRVDLDLAHRHIPSAELSSSSERDMIKQALRGLDSGLIGIIEKLIAIKANAFMTGLPGTCSKLSSFTAQIVEARRIVIERDKRGIMDGDYTEYMYISQADQKDKALNVVEYWG